LGSERLQAHLMAMFCVITVFGLACEIEAQDHVAAVGDSVHTTGRRIGASRHAGEGPALSDRLHVARGCRLEADFRRDDCTAVTWVARKRARRQGRGWVATFIDYTDLYETGKRKRKGRRARETRRLPWGDYPGWTLRQNEAWARLRAHVLRLMRGEIPDPCREAIHWGGAGIDPPRGRMVPAGCRWQRRTKNVLYRRARVGT